MKITGIRFCIIYLILMSSISSAQNLISFENQGWNSNQLLDSNFTIDDFSFSSNKNFYTNYGYNFNVYGISIYFVFQDRALDRFKVTTLNNHLVKLNSVAAYQVSELGTDTLVIEGWNGSNKLYTNSFTNITNWQILTLNYDSINQLVFKLKPSVGGSLSDYNFDDFSFEERTVPVELTGLKAKAEQNYIMLEWQTTTELNNFGFDIERKEDKSDWGKIGFIEGIGTSTSPNDYNYQDNSVSSGLNYKYRLKQIDVNGNYKYSSEIEAAANVIPSSYNLSQNYPNPFNPTTKINYTIPSNVIGEMTQVVLKVYDVLGNEVVTLVDERKAAGNYEVTFNAIDLPSGMYIYKLTVPSTGSGQAFVSTKKMLMLK